MEPKPDIHQLLQDHAQLAVLYAKAHEKQAAREVPWGGKEQLVRIIQAELSQHRLLTGLQDLGFTSTNYYLELHTVLFSQLGFTPAQQDSNELHDFYWQQLEMCCELPIKEFWEMLPEMAVVVYGRLVEFTWTMDHRASTL